jgi:hypothetical protein
MRPDDAEAFAVPLDAYVMRPRRSELELVASGLGQFDASEEGNLRTLVDALRAMPAGDRAPVWELAVRRFGRHVPLKQAAGQIGMDALHARELIEQFTRLIASVPPPERADA